MPLGGLIVAGAGAAIQVGSGLYKNYKAKKLREKAEERLANDPFTIPEAATRSVNLIGKQAQSSRMAGQSVMEENIAGTTATGISQARKAATSPAQVLASTVAMYGQQQQQQQQLDLVAAQDFQRRQSAYANAVSSLANFETERWRWKTQYPAQADFNAAGALNAAGNQDISQGLKSGLSMAGNALYANQLGQQGIAPPSNSTSVQPPPIQGLNTPAGQTPWWGGGVADTSIQQRQGT